MDADVTALERRLESLENSPDVRARIDALLALAWELRIVGRKRAHRLASQARELAIDAGYKLGQARAARTLAMTTQSLEGLREVFALSTEAMTLFDEVGDRAGSAGSRDFLSSIYEFIGDLSTGMELALEALRIAREIDDPVRQGYALSSVGGILAADGDVAGAFERLREALALFEGIDDADGIQRICSRLAKLCRESGQTDQALAYARRMHDLAEERGDAVDRATALEALAELERDQGHLTEAERLFRASLGSFPDLHARSVLGISVQVSLARLLADRGALQEAEALLTRALDQIMRMGMAAAEEANIRQLLADVRERRGDAAKANAHLREAIKLRQQAAQSEARSKLAQVELRAELKAAQQEAEIHRLKFVELSRMQARLVAAERMAHLGRFAAGTAHELNSPLGVLRSNLSVYARAADMILGLTESDQPQPHPDAAQARRLVEALSACNRTSEEAVARIATIAGDFRRFTQLDLAQRRTFNVVDSLQNTLALLRSNLPEGVTLQARLQPVPDIAGWPAELNQAFMTILLNATEAIDGEGTVTIDTDTCGDDVRVRIRDTGRGMDEAQRAQLFDVGWSVTGTRTRMRLGLSAAQATVQGHGGRIELESAPGHGTTFELTFPAATS